MIATPRDDLRSVPPYRSPHHDVAAKLNTNESPHPLPESFLEDLARSVREIPLNRYPDPQITRLRQAIASHCGHPVEGTWVANGSNEIITQLLQAYGGHGRTALTFEPTYLLHSRLAWLTHTDHVAVALQPPFQIDAQAIDQAVAAGPNVVFVCSPNNPTGNAQPQAAVASLARALPGSLILVDEAYIEFGGTSALPLVAETPNVVIVRTLSKAFALAGARIGYTLADPAVIADLERVRLPYNVSVLTQAAGIAALRHAREAMAILDSIRAERDKIVTELGKIRDITVFPSDANFVLFIPPLPAQQVWKDLLDRGVLIRDMTAVVPNALRVTAGTEREVDLFLTCLNEVLAA
jgi:histidinol-phosphate aminotransferase